ncbi:MAG: 30S ribosomal protein S17 [Candidatus Syntropharchaeales archaeon]|nr:30S ribosomal protein S17 [Candidatus Syntrophoarchaeum sp.]
MARDIGIDVTPPDNECTDHNCPFHGKLSVRGQILEGKVVSSKMDKTVLVEREYLKKIPKYERYEKRRSTLHVHNPSCIDVKDGDIVKIAECRPLSKTKNFVVIERL